MNRPNSRLSNNSYATQNDRKNSGDSKYATAYMYIVEKDGKQIDIKFSLVAISLFLKRHGTDLPASTLQNRFYKDSTHKLGSFTITRTKDLAWQKTI